MTTTGTDDASRGMAGPLALLATAVAAIFAGIGMVLPVLPLFLKHALDVNDAVIGIIMGLHAAVAVLGRPIAGQVISRRGAQRVLILGGVLVGIGSILYTVADSVVLVVISRFIIGVGDACAMIAGAAWAIVLAPASQRGRVLGLFGLASWLGLTLGPAVGAAVSAHWGLTWVWVGAGALSLAGATIAGLSQPPVTRSRAISKKYALIPRQVIRPGLSLAFSSAGYAMLPAFIVLLLAMRHSHAGAAVLTLTGTAFITTRVVLSSRIDRWDPHHVAAAGAMVEAVGLLVIAASSRIGLPVSGPFVGGAITGAGTSVLYPSLALVALRGVADGEAANALGAFTACWDAGLAIGAALIGFVSARAGYEVGCGAASVLALSSALVTLRAAHLTRRVSTRCTEAAGLEDSVRFQRLRAATQDTPAYPDSDGLTPRRTVASRTTVETAELRPTNSPSNSIMHAQR